MKCPTCGSPSIGEAKYECLTDVEPHPVRFRLGIECPTCHAWVRSSWARIGDAGDKSAEMREEITKIIEGAKSSPIDVCKECHRPL